jgi:hypothetical protein
MKLFVYPIILIVLFALAGIAQTTGGIKGKVRDDKGNALPDATITVKQNDKDVKSVTANSKGEFVMDGLQPGVYNLVVSKTGYTSGTLYNMQVEKKKIRDLGSRLMLSVDQGTLVLVKGSVFNADGLSVPGAKVLIERVMSDGSTKKIATTYSSEAGEFTFKFPEAPAKFRVTATLNGRKGIRELSVDSAAVYRLAVSIEKDPE